MNKRWLILIIVNVSVIIAIFTYVKESSKNKIYNNSGGTIGTKIISQDQEDENSISQILEKSARTVVGISRLRETGNTVFLSNGVNEMGIGSGVIVSEKGFILTNEHVSGSTGSNCYITMEEGNQYNGKVVWSDANLDLAIIKVNMNFIDYCELGDSESVKLGEKVYAIGNPIGFEFQKTVTSGIVSQTNRTILFKENDNDIYMSNLIQTDATINPGNSGGPLINLNGEVIGINTVKITSAEGIGFAVPINSIKPIIKKLENEGKFEEASIGIFAYDKDVVPYLQTGLKINEGIYVAQISMDSPAFKSGLEIGDIITHIDGKELRKMCDLREYLYEKNVGDVVNLTILRNRRVLNLEVTLSKKSL